MCRDASFVPSSAFLCVTALRFPLPLPLPLHVLGLASPARFPRTPAVRALACTATSNSRHLPFVRVVVVLHTKTGHGKGKKLFGNSTSL